MTDEIMGGAAESIASHWAEKSGGVVSPASGGTGGPQPERKSRTRASCAASRFGGGSGIQLLSWKAPLLCERTSFAQARISSGCISSTPQDPSPPALATAIDNEGALAPAMGASKIGARKLKRAQNASTRAFVALIGSSHHTHAKPALPRCAATSVHARR